MSHDKSPVEQALDLAVFGPLGLALCAKDAVPEWVDTGRRRVLHHVEVARVVGEHATRHGQKLLTETLVNLGILPGPPPPPTRVPQSKSSERSATSVSEVPKAATRDPGGDDPRRPRRSANGRGSNGRASSAVSAPVIPASDDLAIPGYDSLSASQVVPRLAGLSLDELEAVRAYEAASRGRRTILTKILQLQTGRS